MPWESSKGETLTSARIWRCYLPVLYTLLDDLLCGVPLKMPLALSPLKHSFRSQAMMPTVRSLASGLSAAKNFAPLSRSVGDLHHAYFQHSINTV